MTDVLDIRAIIGDDDIDENYAFSDDQVARVFSASKDNILIAAAVLLERAAIDEALTYKIVKTDDLNVDGVSGAKLLMERAKALRLQSDLEEEAAFGGSVEVVYPFASERKRTEYL